MLQTIPAKGVLRWAVLCAVVLMAGSAQSADPADAAFNSFYADFREAVAGRNETALRKLMAPDFDFIRATNVSWDKVFQGLAADQGRQWKNLQQAVLGQPSVLQEKDLHRPTRVVRCTPTDIIYNCVVVFTEDPDGRWRWQGMIMPTRTARPIP